MTILVFIDGTANMIEKIMDELKLVTHGKKLSQFGSNSVDAFFKLPGMDSWNPRDYYLGTLSRIFDVGLPISLMGDISTADKHIGKIVQPILRFEKLPQPEWSEVQAAALLRYFGFEAEFVKKITKQKGKRTPDIRFSFESRLKVDVEVITSRKKTFRHSK